MVMNKKQLKEILNEERELYKPGDSLGRSIVSILKGEIKNYRWRYIKYLRIAEYYNNRRRENILFFVLSIYYSRKKNTLGLRQCLDIKEGVFDSGLLIHHAGAIVVNGNARVGKNCILHGNNVIGNMGENTGAPTIGDNVRLGIGSKVLGDIYIADDVQIGAGALVIHSCYEKGALLTGIPATIKRKVEEK